MVESTEPNYFSEIENKHTIVLNPNLADDFIRECVENADDDSSDTTRLSTEIREQLKKHLEAY